MRWRAILKMVKRYMKRMGIISGIFTGVVLFFSNSALAAGTGYAPPPSPTPSSNIPGGYTSVVAAKTVTTSGAKFSVTVDGIPVAVNVPAGAFSSPTIVTITAPDLSTVSSALGGVGFSGYTAISGLGITFTNTSNNFVNPSIPVPVTLTQSSIASNDKVIEWTGSNAAQTVPSSISAGTASFSVTQGDPDYAVISPTTVSQATSPVTGIPADRWALMGAGLLLAGSILVRTNRPSKKTNRVS